MSSNNDFRQRHKEDEPVFFRHPHPKIYKKIQKTRDLINQGVEPAYFEYKGGLSQTNYENFFNIIYGRHKTLQKFLKVNKPVQLRKAQESSYVKGIGEIKGTWNALVLLVDFNDVQKVTQVETFRDLLFSENKVETGSMRDYYLEVSDKNLQINGEIGGWYRASKDYSNYVDFGKVNDKTLKWTMPKAKELVKETILQAKKSNKFNFSKFDNNGNGKIDILIVIYAGEGAERTSNFSHIYPHRGKFSDPIELTDGLVVDNYILMHELPSYDIGGFCHEVAHSLGIPDLYLPDFSSTIVGRWCLMGVGCFNNDGKTPGHLSAWCKQHLGWGQIESIKGSPESYNIQAVTQSGNKIYKMEVKGSGGKEYFLIENRQQKGFDKFLPSHGLLIWHVDETKAIEYFPNNDNKHLFVSLEQADGKNELGQRVINFNSNMPTLTKEDLSGDEGDVFPGDTNNRRFDDKSNPRSRASRGNPSFISITDIGGSGDNISAKMGYISNTSVYSRLFPTSLLEILNAEDQSVEILDDSESSLNSYKKGYRDGYLSAFEKSGKNR